MLHLEVGPFETEDKAYKFVLFLSRKLIRTHYREIGFRLRHTHPDDPWPEKEE